jgi:hypothetical protein
MQVQDTVGPGRFLTRSIAAEDVFTRDDLTEEQRMFGQTAAEFMRQEVKPREAELYAHDWALTRVLLRKAADLDLARLEIPEAYGGLGLDKISAAYVGEQIATNPSFAGSLGAHTSIGTLPIVYFGTDDQKARYLPRLGSAELIGAYALTEPHSGSDALAARTTAREASLPETLGQEHHPRVRRCVHDLREGRRRKVHRVHRRARHGDSERSGREEARARRILNDGAVARRRPRAGRERARDDRRRAQGRVQHPEPWAREARDAEYLGRQAGAEPVGRVREGTAAVRPRDL